LNLSNQESALVSYIRSLSFEDMLDAYDGIMDQSGDASIMGTKKVAEGNALVAQGFKERAARLEKLADLLCNANVDYRAHVTPESGVIRMDKSDAGEVAHLFEVMNKYGVKCSLELKADNSPDPLLGVARASVKVDYIEGSEGDTLVVFLDEMELAFPLRNHTFNRHISDCQIDICITSKNHSAFFLSGALPEQGIEEAKKYDPMCNEKHFAIKVNGTEAAETLEEIAQHLRHDRQGICYLSDCREHDGHIYIGLCRSEIEDGEELHEG
jgi:hypothetical protein